MMLAIARTACFCLGLVILPAMATPAAADQDALGAFVARKAGVLELLHGKAEKALVTAAQDQTFGQHFHAHSEEERAALRGRIDQITLAVQRQFAVEEMCLIGENGAEISRIVGNEIAYDLATNEADAIFFKPGFAQAPRTVYISPIYMSADALRWVTAYVTPIVVAGEKKAILHYEHGLDFYEKTLNSGVDQAGPRVLLTVTKDGWVIFDSRKNIPIEQVDDSAHPADYFEAFSLGGVTLDEVMRAIGAEQGAGAGSVTTPDGKNWDVALKHVEDWILLAFEPAGPA